MNENMGYVRALRQIHAANGCPGNQELARRTGLSKAYISRILSGGERGKWETIKALVLAMDGDPDEFEPLFRGLPCRGAEAVEPPTQSDVASIAAFLTLAQAFSEATWTLNGSESLDCCMPDGGGHGRQFVEVREHEANPSAD